MEGSDDELIEVLDAGVVHQLGTMPGLATGFQATFGPGDALVGQQWLAHGLTEHAEEVAAMVTSAQEMEQDEEEPEGETEVDSGHAVGDLPAGTRVLLIDHRESFYGAAGTVDGAASATH